MSQQRHSCHSSGRSIVACTTLSLVLEHEQGELGSSPCWARFELSEMRPLGRAAPACHCAKSPRHASPRHTRPHRPSHHAHGPPHAHEARRRRAAHWAHAVHHRVPHGATHRPHGPTLHAVKRPACRLQVDYLQHATMRHTRNHELQQSTSQLCCTLMCGLWGEDCTCP
jgi:hypothetical protein